MRKKPINGRMRDVEKWEDERQSDEWRMREFDKCENGREIDIRENERD